MVWMWLYQLSSFFGLCYLTGCTLDSNFILYLVLTGKNRLYSLDSGSKQGLQSGKTNMGQLLVPEDHLFGWCRKICIQFIHKSEHGLNRCSRCPMCLEAQCMTHRLLYCVEFDSTRTEVWLTGVFSSEKPGSSTRFHTNLRNSTIFNPK